MKQIIAILLFSTFNAFAQPPFDIDFYLNHKQISKNAKDFYSGKFSASDDGRTFSIMDSLETKNSQTRPFYILLVSKMLQKSDGALSEVLGSNCKDFLESSPNFLLDFLHSQHTLVSKNFIDKWAVIIETEFEISCEKNELKCLKKSFLQAKKKCSKRNQAKLADLYKRIEEQIPTEE
jgi:hypothetical protein